MLQPIELCLVTIVSLTPTPSITGDVWKVHVSHTQTLETVYQLRHNLKRHTIDRQINL
jgi:hypothetical protein